MQEVLSLAVAADASTPDDAPAPADWVVYALIPEEAELWQARRDRLHHRVVWTRSADGWRRGLLWP
jgi:pyridoxamine 5'-phosphate oxidase